MEIFRYGLKEINYLKRRDKKLGAAIEVIGIIKREIRPDPFAALVMSVVAQQISNKAAHAIRGRLHTAGKDHSGANCGGGYFADAKVRTVWAEGGIHQGNSRCSDARRNKLSGHRRMLLNGRKVVPDGSAPQLILLAIEDVTGQAGHAG
jgi:hypothetical protein